MRLSHSDRAAYFLAGVWLALLLRPHPGPQVASERFPLGLELQEPLDLARASARELRSLPGIGQKRALEIVESRFVDGPFTDLSDLERIHGIGPRTVEQVRSVLPAPTREGP